MLLLFPDPCSPAALNSTFLCFHLLLVIGDEFNICVLVVDDEEESREGGVNVVVSTLSITPRCIRAVRLSDAFCLRITSRLLDDLCGFV